MRNIILFLIAVTLTGCASVPVTGNVEPLFADALFPAPAEPVSSEAVFALSDEMRDYIAKDISGRIHRSGPRLGLLDALRYDIRIEYDSAMTRNAAQAFEARSGNCLSLVIMTAALAKQLGVPVQYQSVYGQDSWTRSGGITFHSGHVNLVLDSHPPDGWLRIGSDALIVDFLPSAEVARLSARPITEEMVVAMYMNNRAAEIMAEGDIDRAYWWARAAIKASPLFHNSYNTLGVIYRRHGNLPEAEHVLRRALEQEPENPEALSNLAQVLSDQGRIPEADDLRKRLAELAPYPPFYFLDQGMAALERGDNKTAAEMFNKELSRMPYDDEVHFAMAVADVRLGEMRQARRHLTIAMENSTTRVHHNIYAAKLEYLKNLQGH